MLLSVPFAPGAAIAGAPVQALSDEGAASPQLLLMLRAPLPHYRPDLGQAGSYQHAPGRQARRRTARRLAQAHGLHLRADWPMPALGLDCFVLQAPDRATAERALRALAKDPQVESVQAMQRFRLLTGPDALKRHPALRAAVADPLFPAQPAATQWRLADLHARATGRGVRVAVVDSGVAIAHPDLRGQVQSWQDFVDQDGGSRTTPVAETHGTGVAGIIAARAGNGVGIAGIAPQARLLALRACAEADASQAGCDSFALAKALQFAIASRAQVLNLSLGGPPDRLLARLLEAAMARGMVVVAAVDPAARDGGFPASHPGVLAVARHEDAPLRAPALLAPGAGIPTTQPDGGWGMVHGSSYAAAQVSGLAALLRERAPDMTPAALRDVLAPAGGVSLARERPQQVDACAALSRVDGRCACNCAAPSSTLVMPRR